LCCLHEKDGEARGIIKIIKIKIILIIVIDGDVDDFDEDEGPIQVMGFENSGRW
jgi:hypothetical protein